MARLPVCKAAEEICLEVAVASPLPHTLTYALPQNCRQRPALGTRLLVPLQQRQVTGYLLAYTEKKKSGPQLKPVTEILDPFPLFPENMVGFFRWIADYYQFPIGEVIKSALPAGLTRQSGRQIELTEDGASALRDYFAGDPGKVPDWGMELLAKKKLSPARMRKLWSGPDKKCLEQWEKDGWVRITAEIFGGGTAVRTGIFCSPVTAPGVPLDDDLPLSEMRTLQLLHDLYARAGGAVPGKELTRIYSSAGPALKRLAAKGLVLLEEREVYRDIFGEDPLYFAEPEELSAEQKKVLAALLPALESRGFTPFLLHGVTGSGKTEIYLKAAAAVLQKKRQVLVLVPEIALATQLEGHFYSRFGRRIGLLHSGLASGDRFDQWRQIMLGRIDIVIGARSALFAPFDDLGLIIVDEEHETSYKQDDGLRYQARDLALVRGQMQDAVVLLGSATPSVSSFYNTRQGKYQLLSMTKRVEDRPLPEVEIVDLKKCRTVSGHPPLFTPQLFTALRENFKAGNQSLIFLNRRGFANLLLCRDCGRTIGCPQCNVTLTLHKDEGQLLCHYCGFKSPSDTVCPSCRSISLVGLGFGTEKIEEMLRQQFPEAVIARLDRDTTLKRNSYISILRKMHHQQIDILVGTQMIAKGHHFPHVTLVGIVWADASLGLPDFRAGERTFQLLSQVTGRAGRGEKPGKVIIQTHQPQHYSIVNACNHDYQKLYEQELGLREGLEYPPFSRLINFIFTAGEENLVRQAAEDMAVVANRLCSGNGRLAVLGPAPAPLSRLKGVYRWQLMVRGRNVRQLHRLSHLLLAAPLKSITSGKVKLTVDVDPENML